MAVDTAARNPGLCDDRVRRVDHLEAGVRNKPQRVPGRHRVRVHVPGGKVGSTYHLVFAWTIVALSSGSGGVIVAILTTKGR